jgi:hypothetical protein
LYAEHRRLFANFQVFPGIPGLSGLTGPQTFQSAPIVQGSKQLLERYALALAPLGLSASLTGERPPKYWDGEQYITSPEALQVLLLGDSYVIAREFLFSTRELEQL